MGGPSPRVQSVRVPLPTGGTDKGLSDAVCWRRHLISIVCVTRVCHTHVVRSSSFNIYLALTLVDTVLTLREHSEYLWLWYDTQNGSQLIDLRVHCL